MKRLLFDEKPKQPDYLSNLPEDLLNCICLAEPIALQALKLSGILSSLSQSLYRWWLIVSRTTTTDLLLKTLIECNLSFLETKSFCASIESNSVLKNTFIGLVKQNVQARALFTWSLVKSWSVYVTRGQISPKPYNVTILISKIQQTNDGEQMDALIELCFAFYNIADDKEPRTRYFIHKVRRMHFVGQLIVYDEEKQEKEDTLNSEYFVTIEDGTRLDMRCFESIRFEPPNVANKRVYALSPPVTPFAQPKKIARLINASTRICKALDVYHGAMQVKRIRAQAK